MVSSGIFTKAMQEYDCSGCKKIIQKGQPYLNKPRFRYGSDKFCFNCVNLECIDKLHVKKDSIRKQQAEWENNRIEP